MPSKTTFLAGFATGYVLGSRAGRERYEQIRRATKSAARNPKVQRTTATLQQQAGEALTSAKDKAAGRLQEKHSTGYDESNPATLSPSDATPVAGSNGHIGT
jgi:hypothetical protein